MQMRLEPFTKSELEEIHGATIRVFEKTGVRVLDPEAVTLLVDAGGSLDKKTSVVRIPEGTLKECLSKAPRRFKLHSRDGKHCMAFGEGNVYLSSMGTAVQVEDLDGKVRPSTSKDAENFFKLTDALPHIDHSSWVCWPRDVPDEIAHLEEIFLAFKNSTKSTDGWNLTTKQSQDSLDLAAIVAGGRDALKEKPLLLGFSNPVSPLTLSKDATQGLIVYARGGQPCVYPPECMAGGTSPASLAGLLVQQNVEVLASVAVAQCAAPGSPSIYSSVSSIMDMRTGSIALGAPEACLVMCGSAQLARYYGIPSRGTGGNTESMTVDYQAGIESANTLIVAALAGFDIVYDAAGSIESSLTASYAKLVIDNEVCGEVKRVLSGIDVSEETMATDVMDVVGSTGTFLMQPHTLRTYRKEHFAPALLWRGSRSAWKSSQERSINARAIAKCREILNEHEVDPPLDPAIERELRMFVKSKRKSVRSRSS